LNEQKSAGKLAGQYLDRGVDEPQKKRSRVAKADRPSVMSQFRGVDSATVKKAKKSLAFIDMILLLSCFSVMCSFLPEEIG